MKSRLHKQGCPLSFPKIIARYKVLRTLYLAIIGQAIPPTFGQNQVSITVALMKNFTADLLSSKKLKAISVFELNELSLTK